MFGFVGMQNSHTKNVRIWKLEVSIRLPRPKGGYNPVYCQCITEDKLVLSVSHRIKLLLGIHKNCQATLQLIDFCSFTLFSFSHCE